MPLVAFDDFKDGGHQADQGLHAALDQGVVLVVVGNELDLGKEFESFFPSGHHHLQLFKVAEVIFQHEQGQPWQ